MSARPVPLTRNSLASLPVELVEEMREAASNGYLSQLNKIIDRVAVQNEELAAQLRELSRRFEYERLAELFESGRKGTT